ncbi:MAG: TetR/AcrR family transcriptional regulator [Rhizobiaceae bacterium]|nr:TetR/AcrR family transcriptional regulator [Rhizobiaceae bacterium]
MPQVKKSEVRSRILHSAFSLISTEGYHAASMPKIAKGADITPGNIYRYYESKFELFYDVVGYWLDDKMDEFESSCEDDLTPNVRLRRILTFMWIELPAADNNFMINLLQALSTKKESDRHSYELLERSEARIQQQLEKCRSPVTWFPLSIPDLSHVIFMCYDGFVLNAKLGDHRDRTQQIIDSFVFATIRIDIDA